MALRWQTGRSALLFGYIRSALPEPFFFGLQPAFLSEFLIADSMPLPTENLYGQRFHFSYFFFQFRSHALSKALLCKTDRMWG